MTFFLAMKEHIEACREAEDCGEERPQPSSYICQCFIDLAEQIATNAKWSKYRSFREEMIGDAIENCIRYAHNFKPELYEDKSEKERSRSAFNYFTTFVYNAFKSRRDREHDALYNKYKAIDRASIDMALAVSTEDQSAFEDVLGGSVAQANRADFMAWYEKDRAERRAKARTKREEKKVRDKKAKK